MYISNLRAHLQKDTCNNYRYSIIYVYMYDTPWFIKVWFCNSSSSPVGWDTFPTSRRLLPLQSWTRVYHACRHILYRMSSLRYTLSFKTCTCSRYCEKLNLTEAHFVGLHYMVYLINLYTRPDDDLFLSRRMWLTPKYIIVLSGQILVFTEK